MELIHTCYRITDPERSTAFYEALGLEKRRELPIRDEAMNYFFGVPGKPVPELELTYNFGVDSYELGTGLRAHRAHGRGHDRDAREARRPGHRAGAGAVLGARGRLAALLRPRPRRLPDRADRAQRLLTPSHGRTRSASSSRSRRSAHDRPDSGRDAGRAEDLDPVLGGDRRQLLRGRHVRQTRAASVSASAGTDPARTKSANGAGSVTIRKRATAEVMTKVCGTSRGP